MYSPTQINNKLTELTNFAINKWNEEYRNKTSNYSLTVYTYSIDTADDKIYTGETAVHSGSELAAFRPLLPYGDNLKYLKYDNDINAPKNYINSCISNYINEDKAKFAGLLEQFIKEWYYNHDCQYTECENDRALGIPVFTPPTFYWSKDFTKLFLNGAFDFANIMNTSNETFYSNLCLVKINRRRKDDSGSSSSSDKEYFLPSSSLRNLAANKKDCDYLYLANKLCGFSFSGISKSGWDTDIAAKREREIGNFSSAITDLQNSTANLNDNGLIDLMEDRGSIKSLGCNIVADDSPKQYKVLVREVTGDHYETRYGNSTTYNYDGAGTLQGLAKMVYLPDMYGMLNIIRCAELYNVNDFSSNSYPTSTRGSGKVYIPSYLKDYFKQYVGF